MSDARDFFGYKHPDDEPGRREEPAADDPTAPPQFDEAITLDNARVISGIDSGDMIGRVRELPRQLALARRVAAAIKLPASHTDVDAVCVLAMGGSAIGADLVEGIAGDRLRVPLVVHRDYGLPAWAGERTLVIAASHSGETVETVSGAAEARRRGLPLVVISTGGALGEAAAADGTPYLRYESPGQPRAAIGFGIGLMHELLSRAGLLVDPDDLGPAVETLEALLERNAPSVETDASPAKQLAWSIFGRIPIIYGAGRMAAGRAPLEDADERERQGVGRLRADAGGEPQRDRGEPQPPRAVRRAVRGRAARPDRGAGDRRSLRRSSTSCSASAPPTAAWSGPRGRRRWRGCSAASLSATW